VQEVAVARDIDEDVVKAELEKLFAEADAAKAAKSGKSPAKKKAAKKKK
jgi:hypothetical protein